MLTVNEIFYSIQGESTRAGRPCVFVRLTACDLRCSWCDTAYAFFEGHKMTVDEVVAVVDGYDCPLVEVTGGEPLLQEEVYELMQRLIDAGRTVMLETGGHRSVARVPASVLKVVDVKCPGSGEAGKNDWTNLDRLSAQDEVKFVLKDRADYEFARDVIARHRLPPGSAPCCCLPFTACSIHATLSEWILSDHLPVRLQLRCTSSRIWAPDTREAHLNSAQSAMRAIVPLSGGLDSRRRPSRGVMDSISTRSRFSTASGTPRRWYRHAPLRGRSASRDTWSCRSTCARSADRLTSGAEVPRDQLSSTEIPSTYVPARNTIFLSLALAWAEVVGATDIVIGVNALDYSGYPIAGPSSCERSSTGNRGHTRRVEGARFRVRRRSSA
jgi:7-carboxy-7-deazaguanine synthase